MSQKVKIESEAKMPTDWGDFRMMAIQSEQGHYSPDIVMIHPDLNPEDIVPVRIHSECITGDLFHSQRCDCGKQLDLAMQYISEKRGVLIYLRQEGRGIGIVNKLKAYNKQDEGMDTIEANLALGLDVDSRKYEKVMEILGELKIKKINLLTNNPDKIAAFDQGAITLVKRIPLEVSPTENSKGYLQTKKESLGHLLSLS